MEVQKNFRSSAHVCGKVLRKLGRAMQVCREALRKLGSSAQTPGGSKNRRFSPVRVWNR
jgi:ribosomal protein S14